MATLSDGRTVHVSRIDQGGDLFDQIDDKLKVANRWVKKEQIKGKKK